MKRVVCSEIMPAPLNKNRMICELQKCQIWNDWLIMNKSKLRAANLLRSSEFYSHFRTGYRRPRFCNLPRFLGPQENFLFTSMSALTLHEFPFTEPISALVLSLWLLGANRGSPFVCRKTHSHVRKNWRSFIRRPRFTIKPHGENIFKTRNFLYIECDNCLLEFCNKF